ncbi:MAG TPA: Asp-tRNA(Asn)/Glu-tRNA(Gln) amidotransferase subunit GatC [Solirubrobacteraceae bacterium]|nr:Asp-tRNA(Asn)/Glu-tRNA(Gln) amidotransferase subunit GatC [Solirubrobacteraceae bacterium]
MLERAQVVHVARLARLELQESELERMAGELSSVLDHIERIRELDLTGVEPTGSPAAAPGSDRAPVAMMRPDEPIPGLTREQALAAAPEPVDGAFGVPSPGPAE